MSPISSPRSGPGQPRPSNHQLGTRLNNPSEEERTEIEVTDPAHPLFGRRFPLLSVSDPNYYVGHAYVSYRDYMVLCLELSATDLAADTHRRRTTKLTSQSVTELVELAEQCEVLCPTDRGTSGEDSPPDSKPKS